MSFFLGAIVRIFGRIGSCLSWLGRFLEYRFSMLLDAMGRATSLEHRFGELLYRVSWPFRWLGGVLRRITQSEHVISRFLAWLLSPIFALADRVDRLGHRQEQSISEDEIAAEERRINQRLAKGERRAAAKAALKQSWVGQVGQAVQTPLVGLFAFFWHLLATRRASLWLWGLPLALIIGLLASVFLSGPSGQNPRVIARYEAALSQAIKSGDSPKINLYRLKLAQLGSSTVRGEYQTALALAERGELSAAYELMKKLAPDDGVGFEGAHLWIAQNLIDGKLDAKEPESLTLALHHLEQLRTRTGDHPEIRLLEGLAFARLGRFPAAINSLTPIADSSIVGSFLLMEIYATQRMPEDARKQALNVHRKLSQAENQGQELNEEQRKWKTAATRIIGDNKLAAKAAEDWYRAHPTSAEARVNRTRILLQEVTTWCRQPSAATLEDMHQSLTQAVDTVPIDQAGMVSAVVLIIGRQRKSDALIEALYQRLLRDENLSGIIIESFGTLAAVDKDWATADQLLRRATAASPEWGNSWNNWAFVISTAFPDRLNEALRHADQAIQLQPDNPDYHETRGMIHHKLGNYEQAISDLEIAANGINELASVHAALADSHRRLGNRTLAEVYERRAARRAN